jgi:hypothetical protein
VGGRIIDRLRGTGERLKGLKVRGLTVVEVRLCPVRVEICLGFQALTIIFISRLAL